MCYENNCAPNYANIFIRKFEKAYIYPYIHSFSNFSWSPIQLQEFIKKLNNRHNKIRFQILENQHWIFRYNKQYAKTKNKLSYWKLFIANPQMGEIFYTIPLHLLDHWRVYNIVKPFARKKRTVQKLQSFLRICKC